MSIPPRNFRALRNQNVNPDFRFRCKLSVNEIYGIEKVQRRTGKSRCSRDANVRRQDFLSAETLRLRTEALPQNNLRGLSP